MWNASGTKTHGLCIRKTKPWCHTGLPSSLQEPGFPHLITKFFHSFTTYATTCSAFFSLYIFCPMLVQNDFFKHCACPYICTAWRWHHSLYFNWKRSYTTPAFCSWPWVFFQISTETIAQISAGK